MRYNPTFPPLTPMIRFRSNQSAAVTDYARYGGHAGSAVPFAPTRTVTALSKYTPRPRRRAGDTRIAIARTPKVQRIFF